MDDQEQYAEDFKEESRYDQAEETGRQEEILEKTSALILHKKNNYP